MISDSRDVIVVGGGVIGSSIAWRSARAGMDVVLVDASALTGPDVSDEMPAASWAAAGMLTPVTEAHYGEEDLLRLNLESARRYPSFVADLQADASIDVGYSPSGTILVARDSDDAAALDDLYEFQVRLGLEVTRLGSEEIRRVEPRLSPRVRGGLLVEGDHQIDNRALLQALRSAVGDAGTVIAGRVSSVLSDGGRAVGVKLEDGRELEAPNVVLSAGVWTAAIDGLPAGLVPDVRPVKGQLLHLRGPAFLQRNVRGLDVYIVPRKDGRVIVGATMEERGTDLTPTAEAVYELLRDAYELVPGILDLELVEHSVGLRPTTADNGPVIGATDLKGLLVATGHFRNGVLLAPVTADAVVALLEARDPDVDISGFTPGRFTSEKVAS